METTVSTYVFTGKGRHPDTGEIISRQEWMGMAYGANESVGPAIRPGYILVASRNDTNKAQQAILMGCPVWTYTQFWTHCRLRRQHIQNNRAAQQADPYRADRGRDLYRVGFRQIVFRVRLEGGLNGIPVRWVVQEGLEGQDRWVVVSRHERRYEAEADAIRRADILRVRSTGLAAPLPSPEPQPVTPFTARRIIDI